MKYEKKGKNTLLKLYGLKKLAPSRDELRTDTVIAYEISQKYSTWPGMVLYSNSGQIVCKCINMQHT